jgi:alpha-beta hydrolase superfamily lysophospholipase
LVYTAPALEAAGARRGWTFATFDFRGHGESSNWLRDLRPSQLLADLATVRDFLAERGVRQLFLMGSSMGGWVSTWFALQHPGVVQACALIAPAVHFPSARWERLSSVERDGWRRAGYVRIRNTWVDAELGYGLVEEASHFPLAQLLSEYRTPTLIFHGLRDDLVPHTRIVAFVEQAASAHLELRLYKDGDHRLNDYREVMAEAACDFFARWRGNEALVRGRS